MYYLLALVAIFAAAQSPARLVSTNGPLFVDELGRSRIFRGMNVVSKTFPYVPDTRENAIPSLSFNKHDVALLAEYGTTAIRLGVMWPGVEPQRRQYNSSYLDELTKIVQMCSDAGIYVLLEFHQDGFSEKFCGEGVPPFAVAEDAWDFGFPFPIGYPYTLDENGLPSESACNSNTYGWGFYQGSLAASYAYQALYDNVNGVRDAFVEYWQLVAKTFLPFKNILGYDLMNEPWGGNAYANPLRADPIYANALILQPFYDIVAEGIRSVDPNAIIHFEPTTLIQHWTGFTDSPGGSEFASRNVFNFHYYPWVQKEVDVLTAIELRVHTAKDLNCGTFMGEFEMGYAGGSNLPNILKAADEYLISFTGWSYKEYITPGSWIITGVDDTLVDPNTGDIRLDFAKVYSRPYAHAVAGIPKSMYFDDSESIFTLFFTFNGNTGLAGVTEIRVNFELFYPDGHVVRIISTSGVFLVLSDRGISKNSLYIVPDSANQPAVGANVTVALGQNNASVAVVDMGPIPETENTWAMIGSVIQSTWNWFSVRT